MKKEFRKSEQFLIALGTLIFCSSTYLFLFQSDRMLVWFGAQTAGKQDPVGTIEIKKNMGRRRLQNGNEFLPVNEKQNLFSNDTVMTGADSELVLQLNDGSKLDLGPDTLIEIKFKDGEGGFGQTEFVVNVKKGQVKAEAKAGKITVVETDGTEQVVSAPTTPAPVSTPEKVQTPAAVAASSPTAAPTEAPKEVEAPAPAHQAVADGQCAIASTNVHTLSHSKDFLPRVVIDVSCQGVAENQQIMVTNSTGEIVYQESFYSDSPAKKQFTFKAKKADTYRVKLLPTNREPASVTVPEEYEDLSFNEPVFDCKQNMNFNAPESMKLMSGKLRLIDPKNGAVIAEKKWDGKTSLSAKKDATPKNLKLVFDLDNHYRLVSNTVGFKGWRSCVQSNHPPNHSTLSVEDAKELVFTWSLTEGENYTLRLSKDPNFTQIVHTEDTRLNFLEVEVEEPGTYYWDVKSSSGESTAPSTFVVR